jgi:hypothetical protein
MPQKVDEKLDPWTISIGLRTAIRGSPWYTSLSLRTESSASNTWEIVSASTAHFALRMVPQASCQFYVVRIGHWWPWQSKNRSKESKSPRSWISEVMPDHIWNGRMSKFEWLFVKGGSSFKCVESNKTIEWRMIHGNLCQIRDFRCFWTMPSGGRPHISLWNTREDRSEMRMSFRKPMSHNYMYLSDTNCAVRIVEEAVRKNLVWSESACEIHPHGIFYSRMANTLRTSSWVVLPQLFSITLLPHCMICMSISSGSSFRYLWFRSAAARPFTASKMFASKGYYLSVWPAGKKIKLIPNLVSS